MNEFRVIEQLKAELHRLHDGPPERSYGEIADELGVDRGNLQSFLSGRRSMKLTTFARICEIYGLELQPKRKGKGK